MINNLEGMSRKDLIEIVNIQIEEYKKLQDENDKLTNRFNLSTKCINEIDDLFEYGFRFLKAESLQNKVHMILDTYTEKLLKKS